jgi:hypothetical protein
MANIPRVRRSTSLGGTWRYLVDRDGSLGHEEAEQRFAGHGEAKQIEVPHNWWFTELRGHYGVVWYRREFDAAELASDEDGSAWLRFEGIDYHVEVWLNGRYLGEHLGTFAPSTFLADQALDPAGRNVLLVRLDGGERPVPLHRLPVVQDRIQTLRHQGRNTAMAGFLSPRRVLGTGIEGFFNRLTNSANLGE